MRLQANNILLFIEPEKKDEKPVDDELTKKIQYAFDNFVEDNLVVGYLDKKSKKNEAFIHKGQHTWGLHHCKCGKDTSDNGDYGISIDGKIYYTNSLCVHYVKYHRSEVPQRDLELIDRIQMK